jgi:hypothetical protein
VAFWLFFLFSLDGCSEIIREQKREVKRAVRQIEREMAGIAKEEKKTIVNIKKMAKEGQMVGVCAQSTGQGLTNCVCFCSRQ